jgi:hypothetical protein
VGDFDVSLVEVNGKSFAADPKDPFSRISATVPFDDADGLVGAIAFASRNQEGWGLCHC